MKTTPKAAWSASRSEALYGFKRWGGGYFSVDDKGYACVHPMGDERSVRIADVVEEAKGKGLAAPLIIRFQDLLRERVRALNEAFAQSIKEADYSGAYQGVFPIKVNQLREVVEEIQDAGDAFDFGLEVGSKPELAIALAMHSNPQSLLVCNGYKDNEYIRLALYGRKIGKRVLIVAEQLDELEKIVTIAQDLKVEPLIGFRAKLSVQGEGKWATSSGHYAKFGLTTMEMLRACQLLEKAGLQESLKLLHFHIGSQIPNILTIKNAVAEATRYYCQLKKLGFPMGYIDVGGGLSIDYDGSKSNFESSANYSLEEYARDIVFSVQEICRASDIACPDIVSESGRSVVAPHSMLVTEVFDRIAKQDKLVKIKKEDIGNRVVLDLYEMLNGRIKYGKLEKFHDALQKKEEALSLFNLGYLDLQGRAQAETLFWQICRKIDHSLGNRYRPEELHELKSMLAEQYVCNFSVFQSLIDHWALDQLFPIAPLKRLNEKPSVNATLVDITCDSDGEVTKFIDLEDEKSYLPLHPLRKNEPYYLGIFLVGAYQDTMGDLHNLFGRVNEVHVFLEDDEEDGFYIEDTIKGQRVKDVLEGVQYKADTLSRLIKKQVDKATKQDRVKPREGVRILEMYDAMLQKKTYLEIARKPKKRAVRKQKTD